MAEPEDGRASGRHGGGTTGPRCPRCGADDAWPIVYGLPDWASVERGEWDGRVMGGCIVADDNPTRECQACDHRWQHPADLLDADLP